METGRDMAANSPNGSHEDNPLNALSSAKAAKILKALYKINLEVDELSGDKTQPTKNTDDP